MKHKIRKHIVNSELYELLVKMRRDIGEMKIPGYRNDQTFSQLANVVLFHGRYSDEERTHLNYIRKHYIKYIKK